VTIHEAWATGRDQLAQASFSPELDARLLLEYVLGVEHSYLIAHDDEPITDLQASEFATLLERARAKEPVPYLTGKAPFYGFDLQVNPAVLIPRPETEELVGHVVSWVGLRSGLRVVDVGTGSGCIAIALSRHLPRSTLLATDISFQALKVARLNAQDLAGQRIYFVQSDLLAPLAGPFDLIVANLPYVADDEWTIIDDGVKWYEPSLALTGGEDGLDLLRALLRQAALRLRPGGAVFLEIGWRQGSAVRQLAGEIFPLADIMVITDLNGQDRIVQIQTS
jgi:release factor glutamine methyltransferase